jgi:hypothetical protein
VTEKKTKKSNPHIGTGIPESVWVGICQYSKLGIPHSDSGFIPIWGPTYTLQLLRLSISKAFSSLLCMLPVPLPHTAPAFDLYSFLTLGIVLLAEV